MSIFVAICILQGAASSSWELLSLLQRVANHVIATDNLQQFICKGFTCDANFHPIEISISMKAYEILSRMMKIG